MNAQEKFEKIFQYELNNRAFALISVADLSERLAGSEQAAFWQAYNRLENYNQVRYQPISKKYKLEVNSLQLNSKAWITNLAFRVFPEKMLSIMTEATEKYVVKLESLPALARQEDRQFFEYVIVQEQAQAIALRHANEGDFSLAAASLLEFLQGQE